MKENKINFIANFNGLAMQMGGDYLQKQIKDKQILQNKNLIKYQADEQLIVSIKIKMTKFSYKIVQSIKLQPYSIK